MPTQIETAVLPEISERLKVEKRARLTGSVRVRTRVRTEQAWVDERLQQETVEIERRAVDRPVEAAPPIRQEGDFIIVPVVEEELVVEKRLRLKEEIVLRRVRREVSRREPITLRHQEVIVEREPGLPAAGLIIEGGEDMRTVTALFDSTNDAERAAEQLAGYGVQRDSIRIVQQDEGTAEASGLEKRGFLTTLKNMFLPDEDRATYEEGIRRGGVLLSANVEEGAVDGVCESLSENGAVDLDSRAEEWRSSGWRHDSGAHSDTGTGAATGAVGRLGAAGLGAGGASTDRASTGEGASAAYGSRTAGIGGSSTTAGRESVSGSDDGDGSERLSAVGTGSDDGRAGLRGTAGQGTGRLAEGDDDTLLEAEERLRVGKREVGRGGVRARSYIVERPVEEQVHLRQEHVQVERRPVDRELSSGDHAFEERTIEAREVQEEAVAAKEARVTGEVGLRKDVDSRTETVGDTVREQKVDVDDERSAASSLDTKIDADTDTTSSSRRPTGT